MLVASAEDFPHENSEVSTNLQGPTTGHLDICFIYVNLFSGQYCVDLLISIYLLTAIGLTPGGSSTVHIYKQKIHRTTQLTTLVGRLSVIRTQSVQTKINDEITA